MKKQTKLTKKQNKALGRFAEFFMNDSKALDFYDFILENVPLEKLIVIANEELIDENQGE